MSSPPSSAAPAPINPALAAPLRVKQIQGSSAGSGSGDFHVYRMARNAERERIAVMEAEARAAAARRESEESADAVRRRLEEQTAKRRAKRQHKAQRVAAVKKAKRNNGSEPTGATAPLEIPSDGTFIEWFKRRKHDAEQADVVQTEDAVDGNAHDKDNDNGNDKGGETSGLSSRDNATTSVSPALARDESSGEEQSAVT